ncbi:hypothetical protein AORI_6358 [Amycolatopsis keratiniphila]|uniref:Uncharacterized protein n=1 Tax=Amycolatopsis keratiniphila TaxID=129921 RepID=R4T9J2_9PSEU|nr:hypothetical protein AORI_6358 [Amycolatopsis keratiniphila]
MGSPAKSGSPKLLIGNQVHNCTRRGARTHPEALSTGLDRPANQADHRTWRSLRPAGSADIRR